MAEAQPSRKPGGHAYGRRFQNLSNTAEEGELCLYTGHAMGRFSSHSMRYDSHQACTRCVAAAREGRLSFDLNRLLKKNRVKALKFWSQVDIGAPDECWTWQGSINKRTKQPQFAWRRHGLTSSTQHHPQRVAMWFSWGDLGYTAVKTTCGNKYCCNPFHLIPQNIGVYVDQDSYIESFELAVELHTLKQQIAEYVIEEAIKAEEKVLAETLGDREDLILNPDVGFGEKFEAVLTDMLQGKHISQTEPEDTSLSKNPQDLFNESDEDPTIDF
jgi:hypothetical protein|tara:strand:+ start:1804 stop:2619 length:816 start_codon:yes stop_codon:yes gene_type:complete